MKKILLHFAKLLMIMIIFSPSVVLADINTGQIGHWTLDEGSGNIVRDSSGNNTYGIINDVNAWNGGSGQIGINSLHFDGFDDFVDTNADLLDNSAVFTIAAWMKRDATNAYVSVSKVDSSNTARVMFSFWNDGNLYWNVSNGSNIFDSIASNDTAWHHIVLVFDGALSQNSRVTGYFDGSDQGLSASWPATAPATTADFAIGRMYNSGLIYSDGQIDDVPGIKEQ